MPQYYWNDHDEYGLIYHGDLTGIHNVIEKHTAQQ